MSLARARTLGLFGLTFAFLAASGALSEALAASADVFKSEAFLWSYAGVITLVATVFYALERRFLQ